MAEASTMHKRGFKKLKEIVDIEFEVLAVAHHDELVAGNAICPCEVVRAFSFHDRGAGLVSDGSSA
jgi:hypothetical protein